MDVANGAVSTSFLVISVLLVTFIMILCIR